MIEKLLLLGFLGAALLVDGAFSAPLATYCYTGRITGYVRTEHSAHTFDGTSIYSDEPIAAAGWDIPIDSIVEVEDVGRFRVADRGRLGPGHIDIAVWTRSEAFQLTGMRRICVYAPEEAVAHD